MFKTARLRNFSLGTKLMTGEKPNRERCGSLANLFSSDGRRARPDLATGYQKAGRVVDL